MPPSSKQKPPTGQSGRPTGTGKPKSTSNSNLGAGASKITSTSTAGSTAIRSERSGNTGKKTGNARASKGTTNFVENDDARIVSTAIPIVEVDHVANLTSTSKIRAGNRPPASLLTRQYAYYDASSSSTVRPPSPIATLANEDRPYPTLKRTSRTGNRSIHDQIAHASTTTESLEATDSHTITEADGGDNRCDATESIVIVDDHMKLPEDLEPTITGDFAALLAQNNAMGTMIGEIKDSLESLRREIESAGVQRSKAITKPFESAVGILDTQQKNQAHNMEIFHRCLKAFWGETGNGEV